MPTAKDSEFMSIKEFEKLRADDPIYRDITEAAVGHKSDCLFFRAVTCTTPIACEHEYDVCPDCDPCTCGVGVKDALVIEAKGNISITQEQFDQAHKGSQNPIVILDPNTGKPPKEAEDGQSAPKAPK